jgi:hypothetical protein
MKVPTRRFWSLAGLGLLVTFGAIQLVPYGHTHLNPPVVGEPAWDSSATRALAQRACFDCHSNETEWPPYARVAPASWLVQYDVNKGRSVLNFSEWQRRQEDAVEAAEEVLEGKMPPAMYALMHAHARLTDVEREKLAGGLARTIAATYTGEEGERD